MAMLVITRWYMLKSILMWGCTCYKLYIFDDDEVWKMIGMFRVSQTKQLRVYRTLYWILAAAQIELASSLRDGFATAFLGSSNRQKDGNMWNLKIWSTYKF